ncbi:MAG: SDR family oxidoreductase [Planctomycetota bacterium]|mgnify:CR=1 FL=1
MSFLDVAGKTFLIVGVANKRSIAYRIGKHLEEEGASVIYSVRSLARRDGLAALLAGCEVHVCDVESDEQIQQLVSAVCHQHPRIHGLVHSVAFADYQDFSGKFHEVRRKSFLECVSVSCYSLIALANAFKNVLDPNASVVTVSISTTTMAAESYGFMAPAKAALDSAIVFLAKSFSRFSEVRFNAVCPGLLKTSASAGIPDYAEQFLYAEQATLRKRAVATDEAAHAALFLLSPRSSGINAQRIVVDAGMACNYFDSDIVRHTLAGVWPTKKD